MIQKENIVTLLTHALKKIVWIAFIFLGITVVSFVIIHLAPGSPTDLQTVLNPMATETTKQRLEALYGLNRPIYVQYLEWLLRVLKFDFGVSMSADARPVIDKIFERLPLTVFLNLVSLGLSLIIAIPLGVFSAWKQDSLFDKCMTVLVFLGFAMPGFWLALLLMLWFGLDLQWFPISGITSFDFDSFSLWGKIKDIISHTILPITVMTTGSIAGLSRFMRSSMLEVLRQDYILTARAKGLSTYKVIFRHAMRNALLPVITILGLSIPGIIGGSVIIESIFALPGLGQLFYTSVMARDYPLIMGELVIGAILTLLGNLLADVCYGLADPRIRIGEKY